MNQLKKQKIFYRPEIDGLRAFAIFAVVLNHFNEKILPSGYLGVDIFFVISGYVITSSLALRKYKNFQDFIIGFYVRRIRRLIPALIFFILVIDILICFFNPDPRYAIKTSISALFGFSNFYLFKSSFNYFSEGVELNPFTHTWSLGVEEQFYFVFPILIWLSGFVTGRKNSSKNLFLMIFLISIISLIGFTFFYKTNFAAAYLLMPNRIWEISAGILIFLGLQKRMKLEEFINNVPPIVYFSGIVGVMFLPKNYGMISTIFIVLLTSFLIVSLRERTIIFSLFTLKPVVYIGLLSYSIYLWHWGILSISRWTIGLNLWNLPFQLLLILFLSIISYECIEKPFKKKLESCSNRYNLFLGIGSLLVALTSIYFLIFKNMSKLYLGKIDDQNRTLINFNDNDTAMKADDCHSRRSKILSIKNKNIISNCFYESENKERFITLIGDSTALAYMPTLTEVAKISDSGFFHFSKDECALLIHEKIDDCTKESKKIIDLITELSKGYKKKTLFFAKSFANKYSLNQKKQLQENLLSIINSLDKSNIKVVVMLPIAAFKEFPGSPICKDTWFKSKTNYLSNCYEKIEITNVKKQSNSIRLLFSSIKNQKFNNLYFFNTYPFLCESNYCKTNKEGSFIYHDNFHLSAESKKWLIYPLIKYIENI